MNLATLTLDPVPALDTAVRNVVIARAAAGALDPNETVYKAIQACRAAARQRLGRERLSSGQADAVDALVYTVRGQAFEEASPVVRSRTRVELAPVAPPATKLILASLGRIEQGLSGLGKVVWAIGMMILRVLARRSTDDAPPYRIAPPSACEPFGYLPPVGGPFTQIVAPITVRDTRLS